ncbi:MAG: preprotein translocase subunit SecG [Candidatus Yonathbacteria bacterium]|nr:preprotein translocase subunit SecG [Candidatus Yonathbacteria bacterium]
MDFLVNILPWVQIALSVLLIATILLQQTGAGVGGAFGGSDGSINYTRRGFEKILFRSSIVLAILFVLSTFAVLVM